jgi:hypothetical protein
MSLFKFSPDEVVTSYSVVGGGEALGVRTVGRGAEESMLSLKSDSGAGVSLSDQFLVFQFNNQLEGPTILEASKVEPKIVGSPNEPDVRLAMEMLSFNLGANESIDENTRATMRINFGKDQSSTDKRFDTAFWSIAAGLQLYDSYKNKRTESKDLKGDFGKAFGNRPIEIPGGLGQLSFQVVKHKEPPWWKKLLGFAHSDTAKSLVSVLGFPAITTQAIALIDELLGRLADSEPEVLFSSVPMRLALSQWARDEFGGGNPRIRIGCLRQGFCMLARGRDYETIAKANATYYSQYGKLIPAGVNEADLVAGNYDDPFKNITYAVFRVGMGGTKLDPTFNFTA